MVKINNHVFFLLLLSWHSSSTITSPSSSSWSKHPIYISWTSNQTFGLGSRYGFENMKNCLDFLITELPLAPTPPPVIQTQQSPAVPRPDFNGYCGWLPISNRRWGVVVGGRQSEIDGEGRLWVLHILWICRLLERRWKDELRSNFFF